MIKYVPYKNCKYDLHVKLYSLDFYILFENVTTYDCNLSYTSS